MSIRAKIITTTAAVMLGTILASGVAVAYTGIPAGFTFTKRLNVGSNNQDVVYLKVVLANEGCVSGLTNTTYFGTKTGAAVQCFKAKYAIGSGTTLVSTLTNAKLNVLIAGGVVTPPVTPPAAGGLSVGLAADTPASTSIADATNANFTKFTLTAGSGDVSITKIYVTRSGLSANSNVENIKIVDAATGGYKGSVASLNVDNRAMITFTPALVIPANTTKSFYIRAGIVDNATDSTVVGGTTVALSIAANSDIVSNAASVAGAPVTGNPMTVVILTVGSLSVAEDGTTVDSTPDVGDTDVTLNQFKFTAGSTEAVTIEAITALKAGTADLTDSANIELYDVTHSKSLGTQAAWDSEEKATWNNLGLVINKGESLRMKIMADIVGGVASTALTVNADIVDGSDTLVTAKGNIYGFYLTVAEGSYTGKGTANQTINAGALNISKSASTPATGKISAGDNVPLAVYDLDAKGEAIRITAITIEATLGSSAPLYSEITNVKIYDENGTIVAGPKDMATIDATHCNVAFTDTFIVPVGIHKYTIKAKIADAVSTGDSIAINVDRTGASASAAGTITAKGMTSGDTIYPTPYAGTAYQDVLANTLTVAAGDLNEVTLTTPIAGSVAKGANDFIWATASLSAADSGEDVQVSTISVLNTTDTLADADDIDNMELWADLTSANSARGDVYETKISNAENPTGNAPDANVTTAFTLTQTLTITKGNFVNVALVADLNANAVGTVDVTYHKFTFSAATVTGATSGQSISADVSGNGQNMAITTGGALTISKDSSSPVADIVISGTTATLGVFRLAASNVESLDVDELTFAVTNGTFVDTFYLYNGSTLIGPASSGTTPKFTLTDGTVTVPKNSYVRLTLKAKMVDKDSTTNNTTITAALTATNSVKCTGLASGSTAYSSSQTATANGMDLYKTRPYFSLASNSPSGNLIPGSSTLVAIFDVRADASEDVTFQNGDTNTLTLSVSWVRYDSDASSGTWTLKNAAGTVVDTGTLLHGVASPATVAFDFASADFDIPAGSTEKLYVYANTTDWETDGDTLQVYLDDTATHIGWGINGANNYADGDKIFKGDIFAGSWVNPQ